MTRSTLSLLLAMHFLVMGVFIAGTRTCLADSNTDYRSGADFAHQVAGQGTSTLQQVKPNDMLPNYTDNPQEKGYYSGVTATDANGLKQDGAKTWSTSEAGKAVNESVINNPAEPISTDAPFIQSGLETQANADKIVGQTGPGCQAQDVSRSEFTNYTCERDVLVEQACTREASIKENVATEKQQKPITVPVTLTVSNNTTWSGKLVIPENGRLLRVTVAANNMPIPYTTDCNNTWSGKCEKAMKESFSVMGQSLPVKIDKLPRYDEQCTGGKNDHCTVTRSDGTSSVNSAFDVNMPVSAGQSFDVQKQSHVSYGVASHFPITITLTLEVDVVTARPEVIWSEYCPFSKEEGKLSKSECIKPGETRTVIVANKPYSFTQSCWMFKDTYATQPADAGTCQTYMNNPACTLATRQCAFSLEGFCLHENATFSCERRVTGKVMMCGGELFCLEGDCDAVQKGSQGSDFQRAVSELAAVAAAGKDVSDINNVDVRAFTGNSRFCKKFAVGFSNCCKDSGWGQDLGLASCSSEEKALAKAKTNLLTISIGEFCSKKVLGICLEKKRSYCQFDSKLAQIVQQQGRAWQLGIGFGGASSPDCRGITVNELQRINFDQLDFSNFYDDLIKNQKMPDDAVLLERVKTQMGQRLKEAAQ